MNPENQSGGGSRRRGSRGGRRRRSDGGGQNRERHDDAPRSSTASSNPSTTPAKLSFWQKIIALFTPKKASATNGHGSGNGSARRESDNRNRAVTTSNYPAYPGASASAPSASPAPSRPTRKPEAVEVTSPKLYIGNLSFDATESDLFDLFSGVGTVKNAEIVSHKDTEKSKGFGFVMMSTVEEAKRAVAELHDKEYMGRKLVVSGAKTNDRSESAESSSPSV